MLTRRRMKPNKYLFLMALLSARNIWLEKSLIFINNSGININTSEKIITKIPINIKMYEIIFLLF